MKTFKNNLSMCIGTVLSCLYRFRIELPLSSIPLYLLEKPVSYISLEMLKGKIKGIVRCSSTVLLLFMSHPAIS